MKTLKVELVKPSVEYKISFLEGLREFQNEGLAWFMDINAEDLSNSFSAFVDNENSKMAHSTNAPPVPQTELWGIVDGEYVGRIAIRHTLNDDLKISGGHIGYDTRPTFRGRV